MTWRYTNVWCEMCYYQFNLHTHLLGRVIDGKVYYACPHCDKAVEQYMRGDEDERSVRV